jgi:branched-chain amino acid transport system ATP-binding protein
MVLDFGKKISEGSPAEVLANEHVKRAYLGEDDELLRAAEEEGAPR